MSADNDRKWSVKCPRGKILNKLTGKCIDPPKGPKRECKPEKIINPFTNTCVNRTSKFGVELIKLEKMEEFAKKWKDMQKFKNKKKADTHVLMLCHGDILDYIPNFYWSHWKPAKDGSDDIYNKKMYENPKINIRTADINGMVYPDYHVDLTFDPVLKKFGVLPLRVPLKTPYKFDFIIERACLKEIYERKKFFEEMHKILKVGGILFLSGRVKPDLKTVQDTINKLYPNKYRILSKDEYIELVASRPDIFNKNLNKKSKIAIEDDYMATKPNTVGFLMFKKLKN